MTASSINARTADSCSTSTSKENAFHVFPWKWSLSELKDVPWNGFNVFSCFSCGGGSSMGYKRAGYHVLGNVEIDRDMNKIYCVNHKPKYNYNMDIRDFNAIPNEELPEELFNLDILDGSPPCFGAGTLVKTQRGYVPIEAVQVGDLVWTHKGRYRPVTAVMKKMADNVCQIKTQGALPITVTKNHPFFVRHMRRIGHLSQRCFGEPEWKSAGELSIVKTGHGTKEQDYVAIPVNKESRVPKWQGIVYEHNIYGKSAVEKYKRNLRMDDPAFWRCVGRYIGDGWRRKDRKAVIICDGKGQKDVLAAVVEKAGFHAVVSEQRTAYRFEISNAELWEFLSEFGDGAENKRIPPFVLDLPVALLEAFMDGYLSADGSYLEKFRKWRLSTVSTQLAYGFQDIIAKLYHQPTTVTIKDNSGSIIEGRAVNCRMAYELAFFKEPHKQQHFQYDGDYLWIPFRECSEAEAQEVYNLSVAEDESYTVYNIAVHNCSVFSAAGEREKGWNTEKQFREGQKMQRLDDLFFMFIETVKKLKPKTVIAENVKGLISGKAKGYVTEIIKAFKEAGYSVQIFLLNASAMGVPQRRERVFFIAHRSGLKLPKLALDFNEPPIYFKDVRSKDGVPLKPGTQTYELMQKRIPSDTRLSDICIRLYGRNSGFTNYIWSDEQVSGTIASGGSYFRMYDGMGLSNQDFINIQTFPQDYNFVDQSVQYVCGMSVPPVMMAQISRQVYLQWLRKLKQ